MKGKFNDNINITNAKGEDVASRYRIVSRNWIITVTWLVLLIVVSVVMLAFTVQYDYSLLKESRARGAANRKLTELRDVAIRREWDELQDVRERMGLKRDTLPALYPDEPFPWLDENGNPVIFDPKTGENK